MCPLAPTQEPQRARATQFVYANKFVRAPDLRGSSPRAPSVGACSHATATRTEKQPVCPSCGQTPRYRHTGHSPAHCIFRLAWERPRPKTVLSFPFLVFGCCVISVGGEGKPFLSHSSPHQISQINQKQRPKTQPVWCTDCQGRASRCAVYTCKNTARVASSWVISRAPVICNK